MSEIITAPEVTGSKSVSSEILERTETGSSTAKVVAAKKADAPREAPVQTEHIVEVRVAIYNSKPQVLEGARRTLSPVSGKGGVEDYGTDKVIMDKLAFCTPEYLKEYTQVLTHRTQKFNVHESEDLFRLNYLRTQPEVANNASEITDKTSHVIWDEVEEAKESNKSFDWLFKAFECIKSMSEAEKARFCRFFGVNTYNISPDLIMTRLIDHANDDPKAFVVLFEDKNKSHKEFLMELIEHRVVRRDKLAYFYGDFVLGATEDLTISFLKDPSQQDMFVALKGALSNAKRKQ